MSSVGFFGDWQARQNSYTALCKEHIAVSFRIRNAALIAEERGKFSRRIEEISQFLRGPPTVLAAAAIVMIAAACPVERRNIQQIAPLINQSSIQSAVHGDFAVPVELAAHNAQILALICNAIIAHAFDRSPLGGPLGRNHCRGWRYANFLAGNRRNRRGQRQNAGIQIVVVGVGKS